MLRYLKAAFLARPRIPVLGSLPVILLATGVVLALGVIRPIIGVVGIAGILAFCYALASTQRFRDLVDAEELASKLGTPSNAAANESRGRLAGALRTEARTKLSALEAQSRKILDLYRANGADLLLLQNSRDALDKLQWVYLRLLHGSQTIADQDRLIDRAALEREITTLERDQADANASPSLRESQQATLTMLRQRLANHIERGTTLREIQSDLKRVEAQVDLALDDATMRGTPTAVSANVELASRMLDPSLFELSSTSNSEMEPPRTDLEPER